MNWNQHYDLVGKHAFLSPSNPSWHNYDDEKLISRHETFDAKARGTEIHAYAANDILFGQKYGVKRPRSKTTYNMYVNDAIGYGLRPEQPLYYSDYCFGTADAIGLNNNTLRIHDLKTGVTPAHMEQLITYAALFCLEYHWNPDDLTIILRIYQNNEVTEMQATGDVVRAYMEEIVHKTDILDDEENSEV